MYFCFINFLIISIIFLKLFLTLMAIHIGHDVVRILDLSELFGHLVISVISSQPRRGSAGSPSPWIVLDTRVTMEVTSRRYRTIRLFQLSIRNRCSDWQSGEAYNASQAN